MSLALALEICAVELATLARRCEQLQDGLAPALRRIEDVANAQAVDLVTQTARALAQYLIALAGQAPADLTVDVAAAAQPLTLAALAQRLLGGETAAADPGDLDLFGGLS
jgi:hypothetical protein